LSSRIITYTNKGSSSSQTLSFGDESNLELVVNSINDLNAEDKKNFLAKSFLEKYIPLIYLVGGLSSVIFILVLIYNWGIL